MNFFLAFVDVAIQFVRQVSAKGHDARDAVRLYKETVPEDMLEFGDSSAVERKLTKHKLKTC